MADTDRRGAAPSSASLAPEDITTRAFSTTFRGLNETEVRSFLQRVADELARANDRIRLLEREIEARASAPDDVAPLDEGALLEALGEETAKLLRNAREAARDIRMRAEETAGRLRAEAQHDAEQLRAEAHDLLEARKREADAVAADTIARAEASVAERKREADEQVEAELEEAKRRGRAMLDEARAVRERMLADLTHRRGLLQAQVVELRAGRDHLLDAYRIVKRTFLDATDALASVEARFAQSRPHPLDEAEIEAALRPDGGESTSMELAESVDGDPSASSAGGAQSTDAGEGADLDAPPGAVDWVEMSPPAQPAVGDLFARIRAETSEASDAETNSGPNTVTATGSVDPGDGATVTTDEVTPDDAPAPPRPGPPTRATSALAPILTSGAKRAKRALQDEQNAVLDTLRRSKGRPRPEVVLPSSDEQVASWRTVIGDALARAYIAGRRDVDPDQSSNVDVPDDLAESSAAQLLSTLRERLVAALDHHESDGAADRVSARYREWKSQELEARLEDVVRSAYARGVYDATADGAELRWMVGEPRCCADCADNALEPVAKGDAFPTGHLYPPAHPGCRCVLVSSSSSA